MSGFLGIGGNSATTDRSNQLAGINANWNVFNAGMPLSQAQSTSGQSSTATGQSTLGTSLGSLGSADSFWKSILSGSPTATAAAAAPATNAALAQADASKAQQASMGTARGGGVAGTNQQLDTQTRANIDNSVFGVRPAAAAQETQLGTAEAGVGATQANIGNQQMLQALRALGLSESAANEIVNSSIASRPTSIQANPTNAVPSVLLNSALSQLGL